MGERLFAVRLDTPATRRGDFYRIFEECRWELDLRGFGHVKLFASGGLNEDTVRELAPVADAFGVGTSISNAPVVDFAMDIMEIEGRPVAKRGKWSGAKDVLRCAGCGTRKVTPLGKGGGHTGCDCGGVWESLFTPLLADGKVARDLPGATDLRYYAISRTEGLEI
jgi:nicotinate phosphoribosyltransferase